MKETFNVSVIYGSAREGRFCDIVGKWVLETLEDDQDISLDVLDPATLDLPPRYVGATHSSVAHLRMSLADADAFIIVTPEYNHSFTGELKHLIDSAQTEWQRKPVAFVSYGGRSGGLRAVEQLRLVFAELQVVTMRDVISFAHAQSLFDKDGLPVDRDNTDTALHGMVTDLKWWARALRDARYPQAKHQLAEPLVTTPQRASNRGQAFPQIG
ncbi:NAD(P)H-dependent oxidoreductase [Thalassospira sp. MA62]|nr:NAD(P)H-dependent oxidoreductase [Thalassospira sp. MA62]